ncbi:MAG: LD-carboxypeptidase [Gemmatimonas sp.]|nr:LD-carboxypeptidase [Gemmatimonas sp.]
MRRIGARGTGRCLPGRVAVALSARSSPRPGRRRDRFRAHLDRSTLSSGSAARDDRGRLARGSSGAASAAGDCGGAVIRPRRLRPGAVVSLVAPAGPLGGGAVERASERVHGLGWTPRVGRHARNRHGYLAGTDEERLTDLQAAIDSPDNDAIWCLRGGYGTMRILPRLDFRELLQRPRPFIGYSDNTAIHLAIRKLGMVSLHGPHPATLEFPELTRSELGRMLEGDRAPRLLPFPADGPGVETLVGGTATGRLVGGNLSLLAATVGSAFQLDARDSLVFIEEVSEPAYRVDRLLSQLLLAGRFEGAAGVLVGAISDRPDADAPGIPHPREVVLDRLGGLGIPLAYGFPFGHIPESWTLPIGIRARFDASAGTLELLEPAVTDD